MQLDEPPNFQIACQCLEAVVTAFESLNTTENREVFDSISQHLATFKEALSSLRERSISMAALWGQYVRVYYTVMATRAHTWILSHINALRRLILSNLRAVRLEELVVEINKLRHLTEFTA